MTTLRRRWIAITGLAVTLAVTAAAAWFLWLPHFRPGLRPGERYGIDVSSFQGQVDWRSVAGDRISFAYVKATEGADLVDSRFAQNWAGTRDGGLTRGAYHFFTLCSSGAAQAANLLRTVPDDPSALAFAVDLELAGNCHRRPDTATVERELQAFLEPVEARQGKPVMLYVGADFEARYPVIDALHRPIWRPRFLRRPSGTNWLVWQVESHESVRGVRGGVDLDVMGTEGRHPPSPGQ